jgi:PAS domain S-box-containing protein
LGYISIKLKNLSAENAKSRLQSTTAEITQEIGQELVSYYELVSLIATSFAQYESIPVAERRTLFSNLLMHFMEQNPNISSIWSTWELNTIDSLDANFANTPGSSILGNFCPMYYRSNEQISLNKYIEQNADKVFNSSQYIQVQQSKNSILTEPNYKQVNLGADSVLQTQLLVPIINNKQYLGLVGITIPLDSLQQKYSKLKPMNAGRLYLLTHSGKFLIHPDALYLDKPFSYYANNIDEKYKVEDAIKANKNLVFIDEEPILELESLFNIHPIEIGSIKSQWSLGISVPLVYLYEKANRTFAFALFLSVVVLILITIILLGISTSITKPLISTTKLLEKVALGEIHNLEKIRFTIKDEMSDMVDAMNELTDGLNAAAVFAKQIGQGNLNADYKLQSKNDMLGNSLLTMQKSLIKAKELEEVKRIEDEKRNWVTHGLAKFGEIIRQHNNNMDEFTMNVMRNLIDYIDAAQGATYISQQIENDSLQSDIFELKAAIAYGKPIMLKKTVEIGQELLGRVIDENKMIILEDLPERYVELSPGMQNKARPTHLLIAPIATKDLSLGLFELLSYNKFEAHHIEFIEKLCENIASVISSVKTNIRTAKLLEQSQEQADELAQHEEEMRQNLEEMLATQEEASKREDTLKNHIKAIKSNVMVAELDMKSRIVDISPAMAAAYGSTIENLVGKFYDILITQDNDSQSDFLKFWENLMERGQGQRLHKITQRNKELWIQETYHVVKRDRMAPIVQIVAMDKTYEKELEKKLIAEKKRINIQ